MMNMLQTRSDGLLCQSSWSKSILPEYGENGFHQTLVVDDHVKIVYSVFAPQKKMKQASCQTYETRRFCMTYTLKGMSGFHPGRLAPDLQFVSGERHSCQFRHSEGTRLFEPNLRTEQYRIIIAKPAYRYYGLDEQLTATSKGIDHIQRAPLSVSASAFLSRLNTLRICNHLEKPLERKIIVCNLVSDFLTDAATRLSGHQYDSPAEEQVIAEAVSFIEANYAQPISVSYLARRAGMAEQRFKKLFHQIVQVSPYQFLLATRMEVARRLLSEGMRVNQVAYKTGYTYPSNFSYTYKRYFGFAPKMSKG